MAFKAAHEGVAAEDLGRHPQHHVDAPTLLAYAAGGLGEATSLVVASHLTLCPACRAQLAAAEAVGGALLDAVEPEPLPDDFMAATLARLDAEDSYVRAVEADADILLPAPVRKYVKDGFEKLQWAWVSPGIGYAELAKDDTGAKVGLMRALPGAVITHHGHRGSEFTMVLSGGYMDGATPFRRGDVQITDDSVIHQPITDTDGECISLLLIDGDIKPTGLIARIFRPFSAL